MTEPYDTMRDDAEQFAEHSDESIGYRAEHDRLRDLLSIETTAREQAISRATAAEAERDALRAALAEVLPLAGSAVSDLRREARERHHSWWTERAQDAAAALDRARALLASHAKPYRPLNPDDCAQFARDCEALASEPAQAEMPDGWHGWHVEHIDSSRDQLEQWILVGGVRPRIRIGITERDVEAGAVQALHAFANAIERGGKGAT
jgi:hypothetical protein